MGESAPLPRHALRSQVPIEERADAGQHVDARSVPLDGVRDLLILDVLDLLALVVQRVPHLTSVSNRNVDVLVAVEQKDGCRDALGPARRRPGRNCERYQIHVTQAIRIRPGESAQDIHKDKWAWGVYFKDIEPQLSTMWALTDFTRENGATAVVPGSDAWPNDRRPKDEDIAYAEMTEGSVMLFTGSVLHGGGANESDGDRIGVLVDYALGWIRQEENQYLSCPPEIAKHFDRELQDLLGYTMATYTLGYFTPPVAPGEGPEAVTPAYALDSTVETGKFGGEELQKALVRDILGG